MTIDNTAINQSQINAKIGEELHVNSPTKTLRNIKVLQEYEEAEAKDTVNVSKQLDNNATKLSPQEQIMKEKIMMKNLESAVEENLYSDDFMSEQEYKVISIKALDNDLKLFNKLTKNKKVEFLIKNYQDTSNTSEKVLENILPYVDALTIKTSLLFFSPENLSTNKKIALINRLAPDYTPQADETLISLLLSSDETVIAGCSIQTLLSLRNKEYLGNKFYEQLSQASKGKLTKAQHKQLSKLSAKITTICYAYYTQTTLNAVNASIRYNKAVTKETLKMKGVKEQLKAKLLAKLKEEKILNNKNQADKNLDQASLKESIKTIIGDTLKMKEEFEEKQKIAE